MTNMFEGDNETPWLTPKELSKLGFSMILYPTTVLFQIVAATELALKNLAAGKQMKSGVSLKAYEKLVGLDEWSALENRFQHGQQAGTGG